MGYADLHIHALFGVDDGAQTPEQMYAMLDAAYAASTRVICLTPHFHPGYFGDNRIQTQAAFEQLTAYAAQHYPALELMLGNELRYSRDCVSWLRNGDCRTLNKTRYVLIDFSELEEKRTISIGLDQLLNAGYRPVLAHVERYRALWGALDQIRRFRNHGVLLQADTQSVLCGFGLQVRRQCRKLLAERLIDLISSDAHDCCGRPPGLAQCSAYITKKYGEHYANALCCDNAARLLHDTLDRKDFA